MKQTYKYILVATLLVATAPMMHSMAQTLADEDIEQQTITAVEAIRNNTATNITPIKKPAQTIRWKHDVRVGLGVPGLISNLMLTDDLFYDEAMDIRTLTLSETIHNMRYDFGAATSLYNLYGEYAYTVKPWLSVGGKAVFSGYWRTKYNVLTGEKYYSDNTYTLSAILNVRFDWLRRRNIHLYSTVGAGISARIEFNNGLIVPMYDLTFLGLRIGRGFYGFLEWGAGISGVARIGLGFSFNDKK